MNDSQKFITDAQLTFLLFEYRIAFFTRLGISAFEQPFDQDPLSSRSYFRCLYHEPCLIKNYICNLSRGVPKGSVFQELSLSQVKLDADLIKITIVVCLTAVPREDYPCSGYEYPHIFELWYVLLKFADSGVQRYSDYFIMLQWPSEV